MQDNQDLQGFIKTIAPDLEKFVIIIIVGVIIFIFMFFTRKILRWFRKWTPSTVDGLIIIFNFSALLIWVGFTILYLDIDATVILGGSVFTVTIIGISVSYLGSNLMGGIFIVITRPFGVGDIITYGKNRGLVTEIGLNYTKMLKINKTITTIPNSNIVDALIHNSTIFVKHNQKESDEIEIDLKEENPNNSLLKLPEKIAIKFSPNKIMKPFLDSIDVKRITRYTFNVEIRQDMPNQSVSIEDVEERLKKLCRDFTPAFGFEPEFYFQDNYWRITTTFVITSLNPQLVFENYSPFLEGILKSIYNISLGGK